MSKCACSENPIYRKHTAVKKDMCHIREGHLLTANATHPSCHGFRLVFLGSPHSKHSHASVMDSVCARRPPPGDGICVLTTKVLAVVPLGSHVHQQHTCHFKMPFWLVDRPKSHSSTWQKFLSTGPHSVYRVKPYRYKTQSCQQAGLSC
jgi:hypothetical protein